jgi:hypothetical protein
MKLHGKHTGGDLFTGVPGRFIPRASALRGSRKFSKNSFGIHRLLLVWWRQLIKAGLTSPALYAEGGAPMSLLCERLIQECAYA